MFALLFIVVPVTVLKVESPARNVDEFAVPEPSLAVGTVPDDMFDALRLVIFEPLIAAAVPESCAAGKLVKDAPEPLKVVEVVTPVITNPC